VGVLVTYRSLTGLAGVAFADRRKGLIEGLDRPVAAHEDMLLHFSFLNR
jgi:hypothetical protein